MRSLANITKVGPLRSSADYQHTFELVLLMRLNGHFKPL